MQMVSRAVLSAALVAMCGGVSYADVDGQSFHLQVSSTVSGNFEGVLTFDTISTFFFDAEGGEGGEGTYTQSGAAITIVRGSGNNGDDYMGSFIGVAYDPKQLPGLLGAAARRQGTPATIQGRGAGNAGDTFTFSGEEILLDN